MSTAPAMTGSQMSAAVKMVPPMIDGRELYRAELDYVWSTLRRLGTAPADLEDLTHETFLIALQRLSRFELLVQGAACRQRVGDFTDRGPEHRCGPGRWSGPIARLWS